MRIIGGQATSTCAFPSVARINAGPDGELFCSATLIAPSLLITAAHCVDTYTPKRVFFGETDERLGSFEGISHCEVHPMWESKGMSDGVDMAYCVLQSPVHHVPITPILMGCEAQALVPGASVVLAGFGTTDPSGAPTSLDKHVVETKIIRRIEGEIHDRLIIGSPGKQGCAGDSGGPAFIKLPEDEFGPNAGWRVFGVTSGPWPADVEHCRGGQGQYGLMHAWIQDIEKATGIDATPCLDDEGNWQAGPSCKGAPLDLLGQAEGSWPNQCAPGPRSGPITTCSPPPTPKADDEGEGTPKDGGCGHLGCQDSPADPAPAAPSDPGLSPCGHPHDPAQCPVDPELSLESCTIGAPSRSSAMALALLALLGWRRRTRSPLAAKP